MESSNHFEPEDYPMSPVPTHTFDGHQGDDPFGYEHEAMRAEYIDPGKKLYCNYHPSLNEISGISQLTLHCSTKMQQTWSVFTR